MSDDTASTVQYDESSVHVLWETARYFMRWLIAVCGTPCAVAALGPLTARERRDIFRWLRPVEALVRRLLVVEAARIAKDLPPARTHARRLSRPRKCRAIRQITDESTSWSVYLALTGRAGEPTAARRRARRAWGGRPPAPGPCDNEFEHMRRVIGRLAKPRPAPDGIVAAPPEAPRKVPAPPGSAPADFFSPWPLAERIEAVWRVLEDPEPFARRLARRLARGQGGNAERMARACEPPPERPPGRRRRLGESAIRHAAAHALQALRCQMSDVGGRKSE